MAAIQENKKRTFVVVFEFDITLVGACWGEDECGAVRAAESAFKSLLKDPDNMKMCRRFSVKEEGLEPKTLTWGQLSQMEREKRKQEA